MTDVTPEEGRRLADRFGTMDAETEHALRSLAAQVERLNIALASYKSDLPEVARQRDAAEARLAEAEALLWEANEQLAMFGEGRHPFDGSATSLCRRITAYQEKWHGQGD